MKTTFIYFLKDPENPNKGYVGKTDNPITRLPKHISECRNKKHYRANWLKSLAARGLKPTLEIVDEVPFEHWKQLEVAYIEFFIEQGYVLTNSTPGGEGVSNPSAETRFKMGTPHRGKKRLLASCAKQGAARRGQRRSLETCAAISAGKLGKKVPAISAAQLGKKRPLEFCAAMSAAQLGKKRGPYKKRDRTVVALQ